jgi:hypothetical protein
MAHFTPTLRKGARVASLALLIAPSLVFAQFAQDTARTAPQSQDQSRGGWRRAEPTDTQAPPPVEGVPADRDAQSPPPQQQAQQGPGVPLDQYGQPVQGGQQTPPPPPPPQNQQYPPQQYPPQQYPQQQYPQQQQRPMPQYRQPVYRDGQYQQNQQAYSVAPQQPVPPQLTIKPGTYVTVRVNQFLSSDHNQQGDAFQATLVKPVVIDGIVVAQRGQTVGGHVVEARKAGHVQGTSKLVLQLTDLSLVDGQQIPIQTQLIGRNGSTAVGRDAVGIGGATAAGAAIGAAADWGRGAAIGAGAGAAAGILGVLLTRGPATIVDPETVLTFRVEAPVTVSTERAAYAFRTVTPQDYEQGPEFRARVAPRPVSRGYFYAGPAYPYPYAYPYYGPGFSFYYGPGFFYGRGYYRGFRR